MRIGFHVSGEESAEHLMLGIAARSEDASAVLRQIATALRAHEAELFATEGHGDWAPLAESTIEAKARKGLNSKILQATEEMRNALADRGPGHVEHVTPTELLFSVEGEAGRKAALHKSGTRNMPARDPIMLDEPARRGITKAVQRFIVEQERSMLGVGPFGAATLEPFGLA